MTDSPVEANAALRLGRSANIGRTLGAAALGVPPSAAAVAVAVAASSKVISARMRTDAGSTCRRTTKGVTLAASAMMALIEAFLASS